MFMACHVARAMTRLIHLTGINQRLAISGVLPAELFFRV